MAAKPCMSVEHHAPQSSVSAQPRLQVFEKQTTKDGRTPCPYRIAHEGLPAVLPFVSKQRLYPTLDEFVDLLSQRALGMPAHLHQLSEAHQV